VLPAQSFVIVAHRIPGGGFAIFQSPMRAVFLAADVFAADVFWANSATWSFFELN
jgi:hypothetical protein